MADLLVNRLSNPNAYRVGAPTLGDVVSEIIRQGQEFFRSEGRVQRGRLKNAQYLIRGAVTDFTASGDTSGWFGTGSTGIRGRGQRARVALIVHVSDVATGEILSSVRSEGVASSGGFGAAVNYRGIIFGGDAFFRTPLGKATEVALSRAVKKILQDLPAQPWQPRVADVVDGVVVVNGGKSVGVREGTEFAVRGPPREIKDPVTGNTIDLIPGKISGRIRIREVKESASYAELLEGNAKRGDVLERVNKP
jgi:Uncharacterized protein involved in formation of curli polymers